MTAAGRPSQPSRPARRGARPAGSEVGTNIGTEASASRALMRPRKNASTASSTAIGTRTDTGALPTSITNVIGLDSTFLESLLGYNARRAALHIIALFMQRMAVHGLRPVDFSVLVLIGHNPGITSRQLSQALDVQPPNLVGIINALSRRKLLDRQSHPTDGRALGLHLTATGETLLTQAEQTAAQLEIDATPRLSATERRTLMRLLQKVYLP